ncbi:MAG: LuxR C-terminal-related transcriptional regulator [Chromatocurvus sp.]
MVNLPAQDLQDVLDISHRALECEGMEELLQESLASMERAIGARSSVYGHVRLGRQRMMVSEGTERGVPRGAMAEWCAQYHTQDPFMQRYLETLSTAPRNVIVSSEVIAHREYVSTRFYNEFMKPQSIYHVMIIGLKPRGRAPFGFIGLHRSLSERAFSAAEVAKADLLAPCLRGAVERIRGLALENQRHGADEPGRESFPRPAENGELLQRMLAFGLSPRERDVVTLVYQGLSSTQIASRLHISVRTVDNHLRSVFEKTDVHNRTALVYRLTCTAT